MDLNLIIASSKPLDGKGSIAISLIMRNNCLIYFVKAPIKGTVKTRLAAGIGDDLTFDIYKALAARTLNAVKGGPYTLKIGYYPPDAKELLSDWLGGEFLYFPQNGLDLGERMENAFWGAFSGGAKKAVLIGSDIPGLGREVVDESFAALDSHDAVIVPTFDGGYCLIGFRSDKFTPEIFSGIKWSTNTVFDETMDFFAREGVKVRVLSRLRDIDRPEDLVHLPAGLFKKRLSVIIPVLHEAENINGIIGHVRSLNGADVCEIIVADGSIEADTLNAIRDDSVIKVASEKGRARQMNAGAAFASGDILLFLHADTRLPKNAVELLSGALEGGENVGGAFDLMLDSGRPFMRLLTLCGSLRSRLTRIPYGDQAIFIEREYFNEIGGYGDIPLMEDVELMGRIKKRGGRICILKEKAVTSARKYLKDGPLYSVIRNHALRILYKLGVKPETLSRIYYRK